MSFKKSQSIGNIAEELLKKTLESYGYKISINNDYNKRYDYDLKIENSNITFEVKYDLYSSKSGNLAFEFFNSKKMTDSGINLTKAKYWVHVINENNIPVIYICNTEKLKNFIKIKEPKRIVFSGGDNNADIKLYSKDDVIDIILFKLTHNLMKELINEF